jgi:eukaryotic-like serine/threonine-protein kinase
MESPESSQKPVTEDEAVKSAGRYQIQEELGNGATGVVYKAYDQLIGRTVALKAISVDRNTPNREELIERLKLEAKAAGKLDHPNIITIYDVVQEDDVIYLSMQFVEGKTLLTFLAEDRVPSLATIISWADQILSAVGFAHTHSVIHRDLKPANLMLTSQGTIKILDFGIAKVGNDTLTQAGLVMGTPSYMAPEQVAGKKINHRADIFALGSVFYELATGEKAFRGDVTTVLYKIMNEDPVPPSIINPSLPGSIDAIIRKALAKDTKERFQTCDEMRAAFMEQAALLNIKPAAPFPAATAVAVPAHRPDTFPHYLLKEIAPQRSKGNRRSIALILTLALIAATSWAFYTRSQTGAFPPLVKKLDAAADLLWARLAIKPVRPGQSVAQQPQASVSDQPGQNSSDNNFPTPGTISPPQPSAAPGSAERAQTQPDPDASRVSTSQEPAAGQASQSQPDSESVPAPSKTTSISSAPDTTKDLHPSSALDQSAIPPPPAAVQKNGSNDVSADNANTLNPQAAGDETAETSDASGNTASQSPATKPLKKTTPTAAATVEGFTSKDIPDLVSQADAAEERGDYPLARYQYQLILKLDRNNSAARAGLYRVNATQPSH